MSENRDSHINAMPLPPDVYGGAIKRFLHYYEVAAKSAGLALLREIIAHYANLPYENLSKIIKLNQCPQTPDKIRLPDEVMEDHLAKGLGGTCFALTFFLEHIVRYSGFRCYKIMADMHAGDNIHCALIVWVDQMKYLVDPGYLLTEPMPLSSEKPVMQVTETTGVELRYDPAGRVYHLYTFNQADKKWRYRFLDRDVSNDNFFQYWHDSFYKTAMNALQLTRIYKHGYIYVRNYFMRETTLIGKKNYNLKKNYHEKLHNIFGIHPTFVEEAKSALQENLTRQNAQINQQSYIDR